MGGLTVLFLPLDRNKSELQIESEPFELSSIIRQFAFQNLGFRGQYPSLK